MYFNRRLFKADLFKRNILSSRRGPDFFSYSIFLLPTYRHIYLYKWFLSVKEVYGSMSDCTFYFFTGSSLRVW